MTRLMQVIYYGPCGYKSIVSSVIQIWLKNDSCHNADFVITCGTTSCHHDHLRCHHDNSQFSAFKFVWKAIDCTKGRHSLVYHNPPSPLKLKGGYTGFTLSVCLSVCGQNHVRSVSSTILVRSISYLHNLSSNFRRCVPCGLLQNLNFWQIFGICKFDFVFLWHGIWCESLAWVIIGGGGGGGGGGGVSEHRQSSCSSCHCRHWSLSLWQLPVPQVTMKQWALTSNKFVA